MNIMMFCSNPVNGGTAKIFYELSRLLPEQLDAADHLTCCVNRDNPVEIYKQIEGVERIAVQSEEELYPGTYGGALPVRIRNHIRRRAGYRKAETRNIETMERYIRERGFDCIIIHNGGYVGDDLCNQMLTAAVRCAEQTKQRLYVLHNDMEKSIISKLRFAAYDHRIQREATRIITVSEYTRNRIEKSSFIRKTIDVIYDGISESNSLSMAEKEKNLPLEKGKNHVLMIGNFLANKGNLNYIRAAEMLIAKGVNADFTLIGNVYDKPYYEECVMYLKEKDLEQHVSVKHGIHNAAEYTDLFDVVAVPSLYDESFGLISVEAMAKGVPVAAFACGGIPEVVMDGRDGRVVQIGDDAALADAIQWMLEHPEERKKMGENAREDYVAKFSARAMAREYARMIRKSTMRT